LREKYHGSIDVAFDGMPQIKLVSYLTKSNASLFEKLAIATKRRRFTLVEDWHLKLGNVKYKHGLNGSILVPKKDDDGKVIVFDGATIPMPWLISLLTIGILRPLGVVLIGSIVHDYAYKFGELKIIDDSGNTKTIKLARHQADKLFRDIIGTINQLMPIGYIAWLAVRIGWLTVPYKGQPRTGRKPILEYLFLLTFLGSFSWLILAGWGPTLLVLLVCIFIGFYVFSLFLQTRYERT